MEEVKQMCLEGSGGNPRRNVNKDPSISRIITNVEVFFYRFYCGILIDILTYFDGRGTHTCSIDSYYDKYGTSLPESGNNLLTGQEKYRSNFTEILLYF
jgi:hypothetical protein